MVRNDAKELLDLIRILGFNMFDAVLFLDTHPQDPQALEHYKKYQQLMNQATQEYIKYFGPLTSADVNTNNDWTWGETPWPWEREAN